MPVASYYLPLFSGIHYRHGGVGYTDIEKILEDMGYFPLSLPEQSGLKGLLRRWLTMKRLIRQVPADAELACIFPVYPRMYAMMLKKFKNKGVKIRFIIGDIDGLKDAAPNHLRKELTLLKRADAVIVHSLFMEEWLKKQLPGMPTIVLGPFDFLAVPAVKQREKSYNVCFAGNLGKSGFLSQLAEVQGVRFMVYGEDPLSALASVPNCTLYPPFNPADGPRTIEGSFGLVWDGESVQELTGALGNYARYIFHHKLSLYIMAGMPVIVPVKAASAAYVQSNGIGWTVNSLLELPALIGSISEEMYREASERTRPIAEGLSAGANLRRAMLNSSAFLQD